MSEYDHIKLAITQARDIADRCSTGPSAWLKNLEQPLPPLMRNNADQATMDIRDIFDFDPYTRFSRYVASESKPQSGSPPERGWVNPSASSTTQPEKSTKSHFQGPDQINAADKSSQTAFLSQKSTQVETGRPHNPPGSGRDVELDHTESESAFNLNHKHASLPKSKTTGSGPGGDLIHSSSAQSGIGQVSSRSRNSYFKAPFAAQGPDRNLAAYRKETYRSRNATKNSNADAGADLGPTSNQTRPGYSETGAVHRTPQPSNPAMAATASEFAAARVDAVFQAANPQPQPPLVPGQSRPHPAMQATDGREPATVHSTIESGPVPIGATKSATPIEQTDRLDQQLSDAAYLHGIDLT